MGKRVRALAKKLGYKLSKIPKIEPCFESMQKLLDKVEKPIIFDVGAHQGAYSVMFRKLFPTSVFMHSNHSERPSVGSKKILHQILVSILSTLALATGKVQKFFIQICTMEQILYSQLTN